MAAGDLCALADVKAFMGKTDSNADATLGRIITAATDWIQSITNRTFSQQTFSEIRDGSGNSEMLLSNPPVSAMLSLAVNAVAISAQTADGQPGYFISNQETLVLSGYVFTRGRKNVRLSYTGGYATVPFAVAQACIELVQSTYQRGQRGGGEVEAKSMAPGGEHFTFRLEDMPPALQRILQDYSQVVPV